MEKSFAGGCACGAIRYEIRGTPSAMLHCQCRQCQRDSGTGHQSHMSFVAADVTVTGDVSHWETTGEGGTVKRRSFCPTCGSHVHLTFPDHPKVFIVTPGSLDEPERFAPQMVTWTSAGPAWDRHDPALPAFEKMPQR